MATFKETFNRADSADVGSSWDVFSGSSALQIVGNRVRSGDSPTAASLYAETYNGTALGGDQWAGVTIASLAGSVNRFFGPGVRAAAATSDQYWFDAVLNSGTQTSRLCKFVSGAFTQLSTENATTWVASDKMFIVAIGTSPNLKCYRNGAEITALAISDSSHSSGRPSLQIYHNGTGNAADVELDDFVVGDVSTITVRPDGDGTTTGWTRVAASGTFASKIVDDPDSNDGDTSYVLSPNISDGTMWVTLDAMPSDFDLGVQAQIEIAAKFVNTPIMAADTCNIFVQLERSDESTDITAESTACNVTVTASYTNFERVVAVTGTHTKTDWDGARLKLRHDHTAASTIDTVAQVRITAADVLIYYVPTISAVTTESRAGDIDAAATVTAHGIAITKAVGTVSTAATALGVVPYVRPIGITTQLRPALFIPPLIFDRMPSHSTQRYSSFAGKGGGAVTISAAGTVSAAATVSGDAQAIHRRAGTVTATATVTAHGATIIKSAGTATGTATVQAHGSTIKKAIGSIVAAAVATATGKALWRSAGTVSATATVTAHGATIKKSAGTATGTATVAGVSTVGGISASAGTVAAAASVTTHGQAITKTIGTATGTATVTTHGAAIKKATGTVASAATATATGVGISAGHPVVKITQLMPTGWPGQRYGSFAGRAGGAVITSGVGSITSAATVSGDAQAIWKTVGTITATASVSAHGATITKSAGAATGAASVQGDAQAIHRRAGTITATATVAAHGATIKKSPGAAISTATAQAISKAVKVSIGQVSAQATATATAKVFVKATGTVNAQAVAMGNGADANSGFQEGFGTVTVNAAVQAAAKTLALAGGSSVTVSSAQAVSKIIKTAIGTSQGQAAAVAVSFLRQRISAVGNANMTAFVQASGVDAASGAPPTHRKIISLREDQNIILG